MAASSTQRHATRSWLLFAAEGGVTSVASFCSIILMARFIPPEDFGLFALAVAIVQIANTLVELLYQDAVVQYPDLTHEHEQSAFTVSAALGIATYLVCAAAAWPLATLFAEPRFVWVFLAIALMLPMTGFATVSVARMRRNLRFEPITLSYGVGRLSGAILGPVLAILGWGAWALVAQHLLFVVIYASTALTLEPPRYTPHVNRRCLRDLAPVALPRLALAVLHDSQTRFFTWAVGLLVDVRTVGFIGMSIRVVDMLQSMLHDRFYKISLSFYAVHQGDSERLQAAYRDTMRMFLVIALPMLAGLGAVARSMVPVILGETWTPVIPMVELLSGISLWYVAFYTTDSLAVALGRPRIAAKFFLLMLTLMVVGTAIVRPHAPLAAIALWHLPILVLTPLWFRLMAGMTGWKMRTIVAPLLAPFLCSLAMALLVWGLGELAAGQIRNSALLALQVMFGSAVYLALTAAFNRPALLLLWRSVRPATH